MEPLLILCCEFIVPFMIKVEVLPSMSLSLLIVFYAVLSCFHIAVLSCTNMNVAYIAPIFIPYLMAL